MVLEKTLESLSDYKEFKPVNSKGNQPLIFIAKTGAEVEAQILWPPDVKSWLIGKDPDAEKDWGQEEKGTTEDERVGWHHWLDGRGFGWTPGVGDGQGGLVCCGSWCHKESEMTERLNWTGVSIKMLIQWLFFLTVGFWSVKTIKNLLAMQETQVWSLGKENPPEKGMTSHSSILTWRIPWTEEHGGLQSMALQRVGHDWVTNTVT